MIGFLLGLMLAPLNQVNALHGTFNERSGAAMRIAQMTDLATPGFLLMIESRDPWLVEFAKSELRLRESARKNGVPRFMPDGAPLLVPYRPGQK